MNQQTPETPQPPQVPPPFPQNEQPPDTQGVYPIPAEDSRNRAKDIFDRQDREGRNSTVKSVIALIIIILIGFGIYKTGILTKFKNKVDEKVQDEILTTDMGRVRTAAGYHYKQNDFTYTNIQNDIDMKQEVKLISGHGSTLVFQGITEKTFVAYVVLPVSKDYYCTDASGFLGKVPEIKSEQKSCN